MTVTAQDLGVGFNQWFELVPALDAATTEAVYRIRHEVYCRDLGWEPVREDGLETDEFDRHSLHVLLRRAGSGEPVGCTRLILTRPDAPSFPLPFENSCRDALDRDLVDPSRLPRQLVAEVSRLAVLGTYRRRKGESGSAMPLVDDDFSDGGPHGRFPFVPVGLYLGAAAIARHIGVEHTFVLTEPRLARHFVKIGFDIQSVSQPIEHRGTRVLSLMRASKVVEGLRPNVRTLYDVIETSVQRAFAAHPAALGRPRV